jgi:hypothetical protein
MNSKITSCALALALGAFPVAAQTQSHQSHGKTAKVAEVTPAVQPESGSGQLSETQRLQQRIEKLEAALASADKCGGKKDSSGKGGAAMKPDKKAGMGGSGMPMEPMDHEKMDPGPMKTPATPAANPPMGDM